MSQVHTENGDIDRRPSTATFGPASRVSAEVDDFPMASWIFNGLVQ